MKKCVFNKRKIKVYVSCFWPCPATSSSIAAHLTAHLFLYSSSKINARLSALEAAMSAQKALLGSETETRELLAGTEEKGISPTRGH